MFQLGAGVGGCKVCNQSVFLAQRLLISGHLFHRTCFKCARCGALLSVANYYETQDCKYCCETCPDEERRPAGAEQPDGGPSLARGSSLVGDRRALFETLAAADCTDDVKASKRAQRPATLRMTSSVDPPTVVADEKVTAGSDDNDSGVIVSDKKEPPAAASCTTSVSASGSRETLSDVVVADEDRTAAVPPPSTQQTPPPSPPPLPRSITAVPLATVDANLDDADEDDDLLESKMSLEGSNPVDDVLLVTKTSPADDPKMLSGRDDALLAGLPLRDDVLRDDVLRDVEIPLSDDLKRALESRSACDDDTAVAEELAVLGSPEDLEIKTLANKLLKMDYYESSSISNKEVPVPSPRRRIKSPIKISYPDSLNPFDDDDEQEADDEDKRNSTNPFGSDSEDEGEPVATAKANVSLNPFSSDDDEHEPLFQPPLPKPR